MESVSDLLDSFERRGRRNSLSPPWRFRVWWRGPILFVCQWCHRRGRRTFSWWVLQGEREVRKRVGPSVSLLWLTRLHRSPQRCHPPFLSPLPTGGFFAVHCPTPALDLCDVRAHYNNSVAVVRFLRPHLSQPDVAALLFPQSFPRQGRMYYYYYHSSSSFSCSPRRERSRASEYIMKMK